MTFLRVVNSNTMGGTSGAGAGNLCMNIVPSRII